MRARRLEWSVNLHDFDDWTLLEDTNFLEDQEDGGWYLNYFEVLDEIEMINLECRFDKWDSFHEHVAVYVADTGDDCDGQRLVGHVYVREVPATLIFTCDPTINQEARVFEVTYTTLAGSMVAHVNDMLQGRLTVRHLIDRILEIVRANGAVQSPTQRVQRLMSGTIHELPSESILLREPTPLM